MENALLVKLLNVAGLLLMTRNNYGTDYMINNMQQHESTPVLQCQPKAF